MEANPLHTVYMEGCFSTLSSINDMADPLLTADIQADFSFLLIYMEADLLLTVDMEADLLITVDMEADLLTVDMEADLLTVDMEAYLLTVDMEAYLLTVDMEAYLLTVYMQADILLTVDMQADSLADGGRDIVVGNAEERPHLMPPHVHKGQLASCTSGTGFFVC